MSTFSWLSDPFAETASRAVPIRRLVPGNRESSSWNIYIIVVMIISIVLFYTAVFMNLSYRKEKADLRKYQIIELKIPETRGDLHMIAVEDVKNYRDLTKALNEEIQTTVDYDKLSKHPESYLKELENLFVEKFQYQFGDKSKISNYITNYLNKLLIEVQKTLSSGDLAMDHIQKQIDSVLDNFTLKQNQQKDTMVQELLDLYINENKELIVKQLTEEKAPEEKKWSVGPGELSNNIKIVEEPELLNQNFSQYPLFVQFDSPPSDLIKKNGLEPMTYEEEAEKEAAYELNTKLDEVLNTAPSQTCYRTPLKPIPTLEHIQFLCGPDTDINELLNVVNANEEQTKTTTKKSPVKKPELKDDKEMEKNPEDQNLTEPCLDQNYEFNKSYLII